jgi:hypothetical protein
VGAGAGVCAGFGFLTGLVHAEATARNSHDCHHYCCLLVLQVGVGQSLRFHGSWVEHPQYGKQLKATDFDELTLASDSELLAYLGGGAIAGVGPVTAQVRACVCLCFWAPTCWPACVPISLPPAFTSTMILITDSPAHSLCAGPFPPLPPPPCCSAWWTSGAPTFRPS